MSLFHDIHLSLFSFMVLAASATIMDSPGRASIHVRPHQILAAQESSSLASSYDSCAMDTVSSATSLTTPSSLESERAAVPDTFQAAAGQTVTSGQSEAPEPPPVAPQASLPRSNTSPNGWVVQKFGGTSVGKFASQIATDIVR